MKTCLFLPLLAWSVYAQAPPASAPLTPDTVVARIDGKPVTAGEIQKILEAQGPVFLQTFRQNPANALRDVYMLRQLADEAEKQKLAEQSPWKEQLEAQRANLLANAMLTHENNTFNFTPTEIEAEYQKNRTRFEQVNIKVIKIGFKPGLKPTSGTSTDDLEKAAREALAAEHSASTRPEEDAKKIADDLVKKLHAGADFSKLVAEYSEDQETKAAGGAFEKPITQTSPYPAELKKAALALKAGEVSEPIRIQVGFYIVRAEEKTAQPLAEVRELVVNQLRQARVGAILQELQQRFTPTIEKPEAFTRLGAGK
jgi:parvulin-like peptidyl-prolyl isomerase